MPENPDRSDSPGGESSASTAGEPLDAKSDGPLRTYSEQLGVDFDAVVRRAKEWVAQNPLPADLGPEPFNVGKPRPPVD